MDVIEFPFDTSEIEAKILKSFELFKGDPISNRIVSIFIIYRSLDQETLVEKTGFSRSTVSRLKGEYIRALPKENRKPRIYYLESIAMSILSAVRKTDGFAFSQIPEFRKALHSLRTVKEASRRESETGFLITKYEETIKQLESFRNETRHFREAHDDLLRFLGKDPPPE